MSKESNTSEDLLLVQIEQTCHLSPQRQVQRQKEIWMSKISVVYALGNCAKLSYIDLNKKFHHRSLRGVHHNCYLDLLILSIFIAASQSTI